MRTVLIVDDHAGFRALARRLLQDAGYEVIGEADDGSSAMRLTSELQPDVVLLDVQLPDSSGLVLSRSLIDGDRPPVVVLVSTRDASDYGAAVTRSGAQGFIAKADLTAQGFADLAGAP